MSAARDDVDTVRRQIAEIIADVFEYEGPVTAATSADDIARWDSLQHIALVRALEQSFSFAQELGGEVASGGQAYSEYSMVQDDYGAIQVSVPSSWNQVDGSPWYSDNKVIGASITAAADLDAFNQTYYEPGVYFGVSDDLAELGGYVQLLDIYRDVFKGECNLEGRYDYEDSAYEGAYDVYSGCPGTDNTMRVISARPIQHKTAFLLVVLVNIMTDSDLDALDEILATFDVVGTLP